MGGPTSSSESGYSEVLGLEAGRRIDGRYELVRRIGFGAMGEVWAATHVSLDEEVAIKLVRLHARHGDGSSNETRFRLEAKVAAQLSRKTRHVVSVTDHGEEGPLAYLVMELLVGESLETRLDRTGPMPLGKVVPLVYQIARALSVAHGDGVVHRDLKPSNVFLTLDEHGKVVVKILDFGIAECAALAAAPALGFLLGTPAYMSPEQARGVSIDSRADVWALGIVAYQLLTDRLPYDGETVEDILEQLLWLDPTPITKYRPDLPDSVDALFTRAFAPELDMRFPSAAAFAAALELAARWESVGRITPPPMGAITVPPPEVAAPAPPQIVLPSPLEGGSKQGHETLDEAAPLPLLPRQRAPGRAIAATVAATALAVAVAFRLGGGHAPSPSYGLSSGAAVATTERDEIPPPPEAVPGEAEADLDGPTDPERGQLRGPASPPLRGERPEARARATTPAPGTKERVVRADALDPPSSAGPKPAYDRSEIF